MEMVDPIVQCFISPLVQFLCFIICEELKSALAYQYCILGRICFYILVLVAMSGWTEQAYWEPS